MRQVLIVDDDTIVRITLRSLVDWEALGFLIAADAQNGEQALHYLKKYPVDLVITDMKMPVMDGIGLLEELNNMVGDGIHGIKEMPGVLVLSGYDDFKLVRESFRLGAGDYLLKADLNEELLAAVLKDFLAKWGMEDEVNRYGVEETALTSVPKPGGEPLKGELLAEAAMGKRSIPDELFHGSYVAVQFEIEDFLKNSSRFGGDLQEHLVKPMLEFANQIPRVAAKCVLGSISPSRYVMICFIQPDNRQAYEDTVVSTCRRLCGVWNNYMNLPVSCGISTAGHHAKEFPARFLEAGNQLALHYLKGHAKICCPWERGAVRYEDVVETGVLYDKLLRGLILGDELVVEEEKQKLVSACYKEGLEQGRYWCLHIICQLAWRLIENHDDIGALFADEVNYYEKLERLYEIRNLELWMNNYFRWVTDYIKHHSDRKQADMMIRAKRFIVDNYANPELTLGSVAGYIGLNEKYFSSRFTKEEGMTFSNYLTEVRIRKAKELMEQTDLKIYEISQSVGYNNVEHFTRVFKKICHVSPGGYRK